jgi:hypothetical protein
MTKNQKLVAVEIDEKTPCLRNTATGELMSTKFEKITVSQRLSQKLLADGWQFNWSLMRDSIVIKLTLINSNVIQGLVAYHQEQTFTKLDLVESAPFNVDGNKRFAGVGANLFAIVAQASFEAGNNGFVLFRPKTKLHDYYEKKLGAQDISFGNQYLDTQASMRLIRIYLGGNIKDDKKV